MNPAIDTQNRLVIFGTGNPNPDLNGGTRAGDNLYTCSVVALDMNTGKLRWYFQEVKHDLWDYDQAAPPVLFDSVMNGGRFQAVGAAGKVGWFYILNRKTGQSLLPLREMAVPQDPQQATARTQIVPDVPPFVPIRNLFAPPTKKGVVVEPGSHGGSKWSPLAYSPKTGLIYIGAVHKPTLLKLGENKPDTIGQLLGGTIDLERIADPTSEFIAIDVNTGLVKWRTPVKPYPGGGHLATAGDLLFSGDTMGEFIAMNAETGQTLWQFRCVERPFGFSTPYIPAINSAPMTYEVAGRQYIAIATGGRAVDGGGGKLFVFSLPAR
jgi:glucose dehydrogenase